jgi:hypothetical protein
VQHDDLRGEPAITDEHVQNNTSVRQMLGQRGIRPEALPPEDFTNFAFVEIEFHSFEFWSRKITPHCAVVSIKKNGTMCR